MIGASAATPGTGTVDIAFPSDDRYARLDNNLSIKLTKDMANLLGLFYSAISTGGRALLVQPKKIDKAFLKCCLSTDNDPTQGWHHHFRNPVALTPLAKLTARSVNATDEDTLIGMMLGTGFLDPKPMSIDEIIDGYSDTTIDANAWSDCEITWNQDIEEGLYSIVGMRGSVWLTANAWSALMRVNIPGNPSWKPGVPATIAEADHEELQSQTYEPWTFFGDMGVTFRSPEQMPNIQVLSPAAHTDENIQLMLKRVGN